MGIRFEGHTVRLEANDGELSVRLELTAPAAASSGGFGFACRSIARAVSVRPDRSSTSSSSRASTGRGVVCAAEARKAGSPGLVCKLAR
jgi:hypothetical protein